MGHFVDLAAWPRRKHFEFFLAYEQPFFNLCAEVDAAQTRAWCRERGLPFSWACWFLCLEAAQGVEALRMRLRGEQVWVHDRLGVATTVAGPQETFRFCHVEPADRFSLFLQNAQAAVAAPEVEGMDDRPEQDALVHGTTVPWLRFTSVSHAKRTVKHPADSIPKLALGKATPDGARVWMPVSLEAHHALVDGFHAGRFFELLQAGLDDPAVALGG